MRTVIMTSLLALPSLALPASAMAAPQLGGANREQAAQQLEASTIEGLERAMRYLSK